MGNKKNKNKNNLKVSKKGKRRSHNQGVLIVECYETNGEPFTARDNIFKWRPLSSCSSTKFNQNLFWQVESHWFQAVKIINVEDLSPKENFTFKRNYRTGVTEVEEIIPCKISNNWLVIKQNRKEQNNKSINNNKQ